MYALVFVSIKNVAMKPFDAEKRTIRTLLRVPFSTFFGVRFNRVLTLLDFL